MQSDVVVIGGGIIGLSVAWQLARDGVTVTLLERGQVGDGATNASAGMLAPLAEAKDPGPFAKLALASLRAYPEFIEALRRESGVEPESGSPGLLRVALNHEEAEELSLASPWQEQSGLPVEHLTGAGIRDVEPALAETVIAAVRSPKETQYDPPLLVRALATACGRRSVGIEECRPATGLEARSRMVAGVRTATGTVECGSVVIAGGAWSEEIGSWLGASLPVYPVRGQIALLRCMPPPMRHTIYAHEGYLVPRADGRVLVGSTAERAGFDARPTAGGIRLLLDQAIALVPSLAEAHLETTWAGLRPGTPDNHPLLGRIPGWENAWAATGHFRNGILLAPITARLMARAILHGEEDPLLTPFTPDRFRSSP